MQRFLIAWLIASLFGGCGGEAPPQMSITTAANPVPLNPPEAYWLKLNGQRVEFDAEIYFHPKRGKVVIEGPVWVVNRSKIDLEKLRDVVGDQYKLKVRIKGILHKEPAPANYHGQQGGISPVHGYLHWFDADHIRIIETVAW